MVCLLSRVVWAYGKYFTSDAEDNSGLGKDRHGYFPAMTLSIFEFVSIPAH